MSLEVRTVTVCLFTHLCKCERDGWTQRKRERKRVCLLTVASDEIRRTDLWRQREREGERVDQLSLYIAPGLSCVN